MRRVIVAADAAKTRSNLAKRRCFRFARDQFALAVLQIVDCAESIVPQFKEVIGIVERLFNEPEPHRVNAWKHDPIVTF